MRYSSYAVTVVFLGLLTCTPVFANASNGASIFCSMVGWMVRPIGFCTDDLVQKIPASGQEASVAHAVVPDTNFENTKKDTDDTDIVPERMQSSDLTARSTTTPVMVTNKYITIEQSSVSKEMLDARINEVIKYIDALPLQKGGVGLSLPVDKNKKIATKEYILKSLDRVYDSIANVRKDSGENVSVDTTLSLGNESFFDLTGMGLSNTNNTLSCTTASASTFGCLTTTDWTSFNGRVSSTSLDTSAEIAALVADETGTGSLVFATQPLLLGFHSNASSTIGDGTGVGGLTIFGGATTTGKAYFEGMVGIGTSSPTKMLSVNGTFSAGTTTARIEDTGGQVCNVQAYGAVGDNSTDNYAAIMATIAACPKGGIVFFPMGEYRISQTIVLDEPVTLRGAYAPRWSYSSTPRSSIRAAYGTFTGVSVIHVRDKSISGQTNDNNGGRIENLSIDGGSTGTNVHGVYFEGLVRDWKITDVDISQASGDGFLSEVGSGSGNPRGFTIRGLSIYSAGGHGFRATALNDSYLEDILTVGNALRGFYLSSMGETKINNSRAAFNALEGLYIDGSTNNGGLQITDFSTDRNDRHGVRISATGTTTITFNGLLTRRDGANNGGGSETPYAGVAIIGSTPSTVAPVFISNLSQITGVDDSGNGPVAPDVGVRVINAKYVKVNGQLWGVSQAYVDGGGNDNFVIENKSIVKTGIADTAVSQLYTDATTWTATSTGLFYDGKISIGSTTGTSRLLNITSATQPGARFIDTTNSVSLDMRADDFQAFLGTASNHQLRLVTNGSSRLTIDTTGYVGIGTTSPDQMLDVIGTIQSSVLLGGATTLSTDANGNIIRTPSDERLKTNIQDLINPLDKVLQLRGVSYDWKDTARFGSEKEIGFIAQEVEKIVPEVVRKTGEYWSLNTPNLLAVVVGAIQEIWTAITGDRERMTALEQRVTELEHEVSQQEQTSTTSHANSSPQTETYQSEPTVVATTTTSTSTDTVPTEDISPDTTNTTTVSEPITSDTNNTPIETEIPQNTEVPVTATDI